MKDKLKKVAGIGGLIIIAALAGGLVGGGAATALIKTSYNGSIQDNSESEVYVDSDALNETLALDVNLPLEYHGSPDSSYTVYWILDGPSRGPLFDFQLTSLARIDAALPGIVVEVPSSGSGRRADFIPDFDSSDESSKEQQFREFLIEDALPAIEGSFRTNGTHVIAGHSLGGLFVLNLMAESPDVFDALLSISPSIWVDDQAILDKLEETEGVWSSGTTQLYVSLGDEEGDVMISGFDGLVEYLNSVDSLNLRWTAEMIEYADHGTNPRHSFPRAITWLEIP